jgi:DNA-binding transcriptional ArsR family regulator
MIYAKNILNSYMDDEQGLEIDVEELSKKELRKQFPSGWMTLARYETNAIIIDTLLQESPNREFTVPELSDHSGASKRSIRNHIDDLNELGIVNKLPDRDSPRYQLNQQNPIVKDLYNLNNTVERVKNGDLNQSDPNLYETETRDKGNNITGISNTVASDNGATPINKRAY